MESESDEKSIRAPIRVDSGSFGKTYRPATKHRPIRGVPKTGLHEQRIQPHAPPSLNSHPQLVVLNLGFRLAGEPFLPFGDSSEEKDAAVFR
jgi:hypothetical protein